MFKYLLAVTRPKWAQGKRIRESDSAAGTPLVLCPICSSSCWGTAEVVARTDRRHAINDKDRPEMHRNTWKN